MSINNKQRFVMMSDISDSLFTFIQSEASELELEMTDSLFPSSLEYNCLSCEQIHAFVNRLILLCLSEYCYCKLY